MSTNNHLNASNQNHADEYTAEVKEYTANMERRFLDEGSFQGKVVGNYLGERGEFHFYKRFTAIMGSKHDRGGIVKREVLESVLTALELAFGIGDTKVAEEYTENHVYEFADDIAECAKKYTYDFYKRNLNVSDKIKKGQNGRTDEEYLEDLSEKAVAGVRNRISKSKGMN